MISHIPRDQLAVVFNKELKLELARLPILEPTDDQILFKTKACSTCNTIPLGSATVQSVGAVLGCEASGTVVKVGKNVEGFQIGDKVSAFFHGGHEPFPYPGAFAQYVHSRQHTTFKFNFDFDNDIEIDENDDCGAPVNSFEAAASLSLSLGNVGTAFYHGFNLRKSQDHSKKTIVIWGAENQIGVLAVQVARWLGFEKIIATSLKSKFEFIKSLGATDVFDHEDALVFYNIRSKYGDDINYGIDCLGTNSSFSAIYDVLSNTKHVYLDNFKFKRESDLKNVILKKNSVTFNTSSLFLAVGDEMNLFGVVDPVMPEITAALTQFQKDIQELIDNRSLVVLPFKKVSNVRHLFKPSKKLDFNLISHMKKGSQPGGLARKLIYVE